MNTEVAFLGTQGNVDMCSRLDAGTVQTHYRGNPGRVKFPPQIVSSQWVTLCSNSILFKSPLQARVMLLPKALKSWSQLHLYFIKYPEHCPYISGNGMTWFTNISPCVQCPWKQVYKHSFPRYSFLPASSRAWKDPWGNEPWGFFPPGRPSSPGHPSPG